MVHAALVMSGSDLAQMSAERFRAGLSAKVDVSVRLVEAFAGVVQDFVVFFSSIQALEKTRRQSNYAAGSTFVDAYATQVRERLGCAVKVIDWGYWASTGVASSLPSFQNWLAQAGMSAIEPAAGLAVLEQLIGSPLDHVAYLNTHRPGALQGVTFAPEQVQVAPMAAAVTLADFEPTAFVAADAVPVSEVQVQELQALLLDMVVYRLSEIGPADAARMASLAAWRAQSSLAGEFTRWWDETVRLLVQQHGSEGAVLAALAAPDETAPARWAQWASIGRSHAQLALVEGTLAVLPAILRGEQSATAVLFPQATMQRVEGVYQGNPVTDYANAVLAQAVRRYVQARLGAGSGGAAAADRGWRRHGRYERGGVRSPRRLCGTYRGNTPTRMCPRRSCTMRRNGLHRRRRTCAVACSTRSEVRRSRALGRTTMWRLRRTCCMRRGTSARRCVM